MKRGHPTGKPTKAEAARMDAIKAGPCICCHQRGISSWAPEIHHLLSGSRRIGHHASVGLCAWHHRAVISFGCTGAEMRAHYGPSLNEGSKPFHAAFGSDTEMLAQQNALLGIEPTEIAA